MMARMAARRRPDSIEADVVRLIVTTREKFPHSARWAEALKRVIWRYARERAESERASRASGPRRRPRRR
jgi:hypothetical protein